MEMATQYPDDIWFGLIMYNHTKLDEFKERPNMDFSVSRKDLCEVNDYKYMITLDGHASPWARGPEILYSESVPIVVESKFTPLYQ